jgi:hypothetical protein
MKVECPDMMIFGGSNLDMVRGKWAKQAELSQDVDAHIKPGSKG